MVWFKQRYWASNYTISRFSRYEQRSETRYFNSFSSITSTLFPLTIAWCPYCEKVWLQLEEKRIPYRIEKIPLRCYGSKPASFMKINPSGGLPVATIKGSTIAESNDIMMAIEREFPSYNPLLPPKDSKEYQRVDPLMRLEVNSCIYLIVYSQNS